MPVHQLDPYKVQEIRTLGQGDDTRARALLEQVARQVQPIMRRRQYTCPLLSEFSPRSPNLLGLNVGGGGGGTREIKIRLRPAGRPGEFYHYEHVLGTMLHELTHNIRGPHDAQFYRLLDELTKECEELMAKGISGSGQGFDAPAAGKVGGRFVGRNVAPHQRRDLAHRAAQERARQQAVMPAGPQRIGGDLTLRQTCDPREAAAIAAERRSRDNLWCPAERIEQEAAAGHSVDSAIQHILSNAGAAGPQQQQPPRQQLQEQQTHQPQHQQKQLEQQVQQRQPQQLQQHQAAESRVHLERLAARGATQPSTQQQQQQAADVGQQAATSSGARAGAEGVMVGTTAGKGLPAAADGHGLKGSLRGQVRQLMARQVEATATAEVLHSGAAANTQPEIVTAARAAGAGPAEPLCPAEAAPALAFLSAPVLLRSEATAEPREAGQRPAAGSAMPAAALIQAPPTVAAAEVVDLTADDGGWSAAALPVKRHRAAVQDNSDGWACPACTLINRGLALQCDACGGVRPAGFTL